MSETPNNVNDFTLNDRLKAEWWNENKDKFRLEDLNEIPAKLKRLREAEDELVRLEKANEILELDLSSLQGKIDSLETRDIGFPIERMDEQRKLDFIKENWEALTLDKLETLV